MRPQSLAILIASTVTAIFLGVVGVVALMNLMPTPAANGPNGGRMAKNADVFFAPAVVPEIAIDDGFEVPAIEPPQNFGPAIQPAELPRMRGKAVAAKEYELTGPHAHGNLAVFLIHGEDQAQNLRIMTLQE